MSTELGYGDAAGRYWAAGWRGVIPLAAGTKWPPPAGYTGGDGLDPSYADLTAWAETRAGDGLALRLPPDVIGIDVDAYGDKTGAATLTEAELRWGALPATARSTSRAGDGDPVSGVYLYRVPPGTRLASRLAFGELELGNVEIIQHCHRYVMAWPSMHPEGRRYAWLGDYGAELDIPDPATLPELPPAWLEALRETAAMVLDVQAVDVAACITGGNPSPRVVERLHAALADLGRPGASRHDTACEHALALLRYGKQGDPGTEGALLYLRSAFVTAVTSDGSRTLDAAAGEFNRFFTNAGAGRLLAQPDTDAWTRNLAGGLDLGELAPAMMTNGAGAHVGAPGPLELEKLEADFWSARPGHQLIYAAALASSSSPWAVLAAVVARALCLVPPHMRLPPIVGAAGGSLNWFCVLAGKSGGGKGIANGVAGELLPAAWLAIRSIGSGEGMVDAYQRDQRGKNPPPPITSILFHAEEIDSLAALGDRRGQTTLPILRQGFSGETLGYTYRGRAGAVVPAHTYRMCLIAGVQPERAGVLLDNAAGGTPQRFMWFPAGDKRVAGPRPAWPVDALGRPRIVKSFSQTDLGREAPLIKVAPIVAAEILAAHRARVSGADDGDTLESHGMFAREKFAFGLAYIDERTEINADDWRLSGIGAAVSARTRDWAAGKYRAGAARVAAEHGELRGIEYASARAAERVAGAEAIERVARRILDKLAELGPLTPRELHHAIAHRDRKAGYLEAAQNKLGEAGRIRLVEGKWTLCQQT